MNTASEGLKQNGEDLNYTIATACCFHNFTLDLPFAVPREALTNKNPDENNRPLKVDEEQDTQEGIQKRNEIAAYFMDQIQLSDVEE